MGESCKKAVGGIEFPQSDDRYTITSNFELELEGEYDCEITSDFFPSLCFPSLSRGKYFRIRVLSLLGGNKKPHHHKYRVEILQ